MQLLLCTVHYVNRLNQQQHNWTAPYLGIERDWWLEIITTTTSSPPLIAIHISSSSSSRTTIEHYTPRRVRVTRQLMQSSPQRVLELNQEIKGGCVHQHHHQCSLPNQCCRPPCNTFRIGNSAVLSWIFQQLQQLQ